MRLFQPDFFDERYVNMKSQAVAWRKALTPGRLTLLALIFIYTLAGNQALGQNSHASSAGPLALDGRLTILVNEDAPRPISAPLKTSRQISGGCSDQT